MLQCCKNWQIGWYDDRKETITPDASDPNWSVEHTIVGIADYNHTATRDLNVVLKLETGTSEDYFIGFNRATGANAQNDEADDELTIVKTGNNGELYSQSYLQAHLTAGESHILVGNGAPVQVTLVGILKPASGPWRATLKVENDGSAAPTPLPTSQPTPQPTTAAPTSTACISGKELVVDITKDDYPDETSWTLEDMCTGQTVDAGDVRGKSMCIPDAQYKFTLKDSYGDGICCSYGSGSYRVMYGGSMVKQGGQFESTETTTFGSCAADPTEPVS